MPPGSFLTLNTCDTTARGGAANVKICRDMHARTLSTRITKAAAECTEMNKGERRESSDGCHGTSHFSNLRIIFDRVSGV